MEIYEKVQPNLNFVEREKATRKFWEENGIFKKSIEEREGCESYTFFDGPPTANGKPHIGHVLTRVIKDMVPRYQTMKGKRVLIVDDVISTGGSLLSLENLVRQSGGEVVGKMAILAEGEAAAREDIIFLEKLPLFDTEGHAL